MHIHIQTSFFERHPLVTRVTQHDHLSSIATAQWNKECLRKGKKEPTTEAGKSSDFGQPHPTHLLHTKPRLDASI